jgi:hypothetical protein
MSAGFIPPAMENKMPVLHPMPYESFADFLQRQAPKGWSILDLCHNRYRIETGDGLSAAIDERGGISAGWTVKVRDTGISREFTVTAPDGRELFFHDCWHP